VTLPNGVQLLRPGKVGLHVTRSKRIEELRNVSSHTSLFCQFKPRDLAYVKLNGKRFYLGKYGSDASRRKYDRLVSA
jgi:hypothetical protein